MVNLLQEFVVNLLPDFTVNLLTGFVANLLQHTRAPFHQKNTEGTKIEVPSQVADHSVYKFGYAGNFSCC